MEKNEDTESLSSSDNEYMKKVVLRKRKNIRHEANSFFG